jgi:Ca2+-binding RTX toxin-like protein
LNVLAGAMLTGSGRIAGNVNNAGLVLPGSSPGTLTITGNFTQTAGGILRVELGGRSAGLFDQLRVLGTVTLGGSLEAAFVNGFVSASGDRFVVVDNDMADAVTGIFASLPEGSILSVGGRKLHVSYVGGTGNDVLLTDATTAALIPDCCQPGKQALLVLGTSGRDLIDITPVGGSGAVQVDMNGVTQGVFSPSGRIIVKAGAGNDTIKVADGVSRSTWLYGEAGKDSLKGGAGPDVLLGGSGDDSLNGGNGRDLLIGGLGANRIVGGGADDILIGGKTTFDANEAALFGVMSEWNSSRSYTSRIANLRGTGTGTDFANRLNGNFFLTTDGPSATVLDDGAVDVISGSGGFDWYLINSDGNNIDTITDLTAGERVDDVD